MTRTTCRFCEGLITKRYNQFCNKQCFWLWKKREADANFLVRLNEKIDRSGGEDACHPWTGNVYGSGYGYIARGPRVLRRVNRVIWELHYGEIPAGMFVCHHCDNRLCANIKHLFLGTPKENTQDMLAKGRRPSRKGSKNNRAKLTEDQVIEIRARYALGGITQKRLSEIYGVGHGCIESVITRRSWPHL